MVVVQLFFQIQRVVRRVFCSYLGLLVNCKNDLALVYTLDNPNRSLGHIAFTDLRHAACDNTSSLFLVNLQWLQIDKFTIAHIFVQLHIFLSLMWMLINCLLVCSDSDIVCQGHTAGRKGVCPTWVSPLKEAHKGFIGISQFCRPVSRHFRRNPQSKVCFHALFGLNRNSVGTVCLTLANIYSCNVDSRHLLCSEWNYLTIENWAIYIYI